MRSTRNCDCDRAVCSGIRKPPIIIDQRLLACENLTPVVIPQGVVGAQRQTLQRGEDFFGRVIRWLIFLSNRFYIFGFVLVFRQILSMPSRSTEQYACRCCDEAINFSLSLEFLVRHSISTCLQIKLPNR